MNAETLEEYIQSKGIQARIVRVNIPTPTVDSAAKALGTSVDQIVKSLLFLIEGKPVLVISSGTSRVDQKKIAQRYEVGHRKVKLADPQTVMEVTGYEVGAVPPFGHLQKLDVILEKSIFTQEIIYAGGGSIEALLEIKPDEILRVTGATLLDLHAEMEVD